MNSENLSPKQLTAIAHLAAGLTHKEAGERAGVSRSTITRWLSSKTFQDELEKRQTALLEQHLQEVAATQSNDIDKLYEDLEAYRVARLNVYKSLLNRGIKVLQQVGRRFDDLPDEAIAPQQIPALLSISLQLCETGMNGWAEHLALDELIRRLDGEGDRPTPHP